MEQKTYGYIRVSTIAQHDDRQRLAMEGFGVEEQFLFADKQSGKDFDRPAYQALLGQLGADDTLVVNIKTRYLIQSYLWVQSSKSLATRGFGDFAFWGVRHRSIK